MKNEIMQRVHDHLEEARERFDDSRIVGVFLQGSQNYGLQIPTSDVDTKLILTPTFEEIVFNKKPISTTHVRANDEHTDLKDIRLMFSTFRKQNLNFIEILFTPYLWVNPLFADEWSRLTAEREKIAHYSPYSAVKTMKRVQEYIHRYTEGESYEDCLHPRNPEFLVAVKQGYFNLEQARISANSAMEDVIATADAFCEKVGKSFDPEVDELLDDVQYNIVKAAIQKEF